MFSIEVNLILKKRSYKENLIRSDNFSGRKMVLKLLIKAKTLYMGLITVDVR